MEILWVCVLGALQGILEFLPISSSGILFLLEKRIGIADEALPLMNLFLHAGTAFAVLVVLSRDAGRCLSEFGRAASGALTNVRIFITGSPEKYLKPAHTTYGHLSVMIFYAALCAGGCGLSLSYIARGISGSVLYTGIGFILNGILLLVLARVRIKPSRIKDVPLGRGVFIGAAGGAAIIPGVSWGGLTEGAAVLSGLGLKAAIRFSYLLSVPAAFGGLILELISTVRSGNLTPGFFAAAVSGSAVSFLVGAFMLRRAQQFLRRRGFMPFAVLSLAVGTAVVLVSFF